MTGAVPVDETRSQYVKRNAHPLFPIAILSAALSVTAVGALAAAPAAGATDTGRADQAEALAEVRAATAKYHRVEVALADGYLPTEHCVESPEGSMGYHYVLPERLSAPLDPERPAVLLYTPTPDGPRLAGVEYVTVDADQDLSTDEDRPSLFGVPFDGPMLGHEPGQPVHYDLHTWIWAHNPAGVFAPWNPALSC